MNRARHARVNLSQVGAALVRAGTSLDMGGGWILEGRVREMGDVVDGKPDRDWYRGGPSGGDGVTCGRGLGAGVLWQ